MACLFPHPRDATTRSRRGRRSPRTRSTGESGPVTGKWRPVTNHDNCHAGPNEYLRPCAVGKSELNHLDTMTRPATKECQRQGPRLHEPTESQQGAACSPHAPRTAVRRIPMNCGCVRELEVDGRHPSRRRLRRRYDVPGVQERHLRLRRPTSESSHGVDVLAELIESSRTSDSQRVRPNRRRRYPFDTTHVKLQKLSQTL